MMITFGLSAAVADVVGKKNSIESRRQSRRSILVMAEFLAPYFLPCKMNYGQAALYPTLERFASDRTK